MAFLHGTISAAGTIRRLVTTGLMVTASSIALAQAILKTGATVKAYTDIEYDRVGGASLKLDLYVPKQNDVPLRPCVVFLHGGGWTSGDKKEFTLYAREMAQRGYVAATVNYRLAPKHRYPAAVEDSQHAVRWLREHSAEYRLDPMRIGVMGASAGAYLAAMLGVRDAGPSAIQARVQCVVSYYGRMDLTVEQYGPRFSDFRPVFLGRKRMDAPTLYVEASPITWVDSHTCPFLLVHGTKDTQVTDLQSEKMLEALEKNNVEASLLLLAGAGHGFKKHYAEEAWDAAKSFLDLHLKQATQPALPSKFEAVLSGQASQ